MRVRSTRRRGGVAAVSKLDDGRVVCPHARLALRAPARMRGLLGRSRLEPGEGLLLRPASAVHTAFMRFAIDAVFLDRDLRVVGVREPVPPWRVAAVRGADSVLELAAGECRRLELVAGTQLAVDAPRS